MTKTINHIEVPKEWEGQLDYGSHLPILYLALTKTEDKCVEFGSGLSSTPLLQDYCRDKNRNFITYENDKEWAEKTGSVYTDNFFKELGEIDLLFVDSAPGEQRKDLINHYRKETKVIVLHDTEVGAQGIYGIRELLKSFKYRLDYCPVGMPATSVLSDKIDVTKWI